MFNDPREFSIEDKVLFHHQVKHSGYKISDLVQWKCNGCNETSLSFYEKKHWTFDDVRDSIAEIVDIIPCSHKRGVVLVLKIPGIVEHFFVRPDGVKKVNLLNKIVEKINEELYE